MKGIDPLHLVTRIGDEDNAASNGNEVGMIDGDAPPIGQANLEGSKRCLVQPVPESFDVEHSVLSVNRTTGLIQESGDGVEGVEE